MLKRLSTMWETRVRSLGWEDLLEKEMAIHSSTIAWKIPWTEEPSRLQSMAQGGGQGASLSGPGVGGRESGVGIGSWEGRSEIKEFYL